MSYCASRFRTIRRPSVEVKIGAVPIGGRNPIRLQSMTTSDTQDIDATVKQCIALAEVGCEIVRITAPNVPAARCLKDIRTRFSQAGFSNIPLVADIHFLPQAAMEAVEHVEKIRINPGNYADKKKFAVHEYTDADYDLELQRIHESVSPLIKRCKELGRSLRIGTNHGSLSDRIMNRFGDTPMGMVRSALEFVRISEDNNFHDIVLSMKASNPKVMIQAYRLLVAHMDTAHRAYPLHLGVTEAGDGEDGRIKSAIGIGTLLMDGIGDTIRVSLTEDSVHEIPVARAIAEKAMSLWSRHSNTGHALEIPDSIDPYKFARRETASIELAPSILTGPDQLPRVIVPADIDTLADSRHPAANPILRDTPAEGLLIKLENVGDISRLLALKGYPALTGRFLVLDLAQSITPADMAPVLASFQGRVIPSRGFKADDSAALSAFLALAKSHQAPFAAAVTPQALSELAPTIPPGAPVIITLDTSAGTPLTGAHAVGEYRRLTEILRLAENPAPIWIRNTRETALRYDESFLARLLEGSFLTGALLCDGIGDIVSIETEPDFITSTKLAYNILQGAGARITKTEFVACPSCGRTLFDLQSTTQRIRAQTGHLKGVKIAIMGCIVNGPGEMADADFGYVGGAPGKINLYVGKNCVQYNIPQAEADARLIALIREHGRWTNPEPVGNS